MSNFVLKYNNSPISIEIGSASDVWSGDYTDTSWQSTLTKVDDVGYISISTASQFVNMGNNIVSFYTNNSLSELNVNLEADLTFNSVDSLTTASQVYNTLILGKKANSSTGPLFTVTGGKRVLIHGNGHILKGLYCYITVNVNGGSFLKLDDSYFIVENLTFDRCLFRSNAQATAGFCMTNRGATFETKFVNFTKCAASSESTSSYQCIMFGFLNTEIGSINKNSTFIIHTQTAFYKCGFAAKKAVDEMSCGDAGITDWSSTPRFGSWWTDCTNIEPFKLNHSSNNSYRLYYGIRASYYEDGNVTYYNCGDGITPQGTDASSIENALNLLNGTDLVELNPDYEVVLVNDNLYHKIEISEPIKYKLTFVIN